jgi:hypothetical protein
MFMQNEPFLSAEVDYRRERAVQAMAGRRPAARPARPARRSRPRARVLAHRLVPGL